MKTGVMTWIDDELEAEAVAARMRPLQADAVGRDAVGCLREGFTDLGSVGPAAVAAFLGRRDDEGV